MCAVRSGSAPSGQESTLVFAVKAVTGAAIHASPIAPGYKLDRYELLCPIAEGGMASVWVARQRGKHGFEKLVAIKTILPKFASDVRFQDMFLDEARIASRIEHTNVAQIFDLGEENEILYLVMEYVEGDALSKLNRICQKKGLKIPTGIVLRVLADTCAGLHEAHEMKDAGGRLLEIVHRDVSPHNILVSTRGTAKLIDFGIATARSRAGAETNSGVLKGKIQYMAPEQALGHRLDRRADIWAVGAILYTLIAGKPPYEGDNPLATLHLLGSGRPPVPLPANVHPSIAGIVRKALSFAPESRYGTAAQMRDAIEGAISASRDMTTTAEVAAFAAIHLTDRVEKRRQTVEMALAAAGERERAEQRFGAGRPSSMLPPMPAAGPPPSAPSSRSLLTPPPRSARTLAEAPAAKPPSEELLARLTPRTSEPPPQASSYATIGSASLDASGQAPKSRKGVFAALGVIALAAAVAAAVSFTMMRPPPSTQAVVGGAPPVQATTAATMTKAVTSPPVSSPTASESWGIMPTVAATALPKANANAPTFQPPAPMAPRRPIAGSSRSRRKGTDSDTPASEGESPTPEATPTPPPPPAQKPPGTVDDGF
jgi:eukaryotic-like serine/threonine-protein kinase